VRSIHIAPEYVEALTSSVLTEWERRQVVLKTDELNIDAKIKALKTQIGLAMEKLTFLTSEITIKYMEEEITKLGNEIKGLEFEKEKQAAKEPPDSQQPPPKVVAWLQPERLRVSYSVSGGSHLSNHADLAPAAI